MLEALALPAVLSITILFAGCTTVWLLYGSALRGYIHKGDHHAAEVTLVAMFGSFLPTLLVMALPWIYL